MRVVTVIYLPTTVHFDFTFIADIIRWMLLALNNNAKKKIHVDKWLPSGILFAER